MSVRAGEKASRQCPRPGVTFLTRPTPSCPGQLSPSWYDEPLSDATGLAKPLRQGGERRGRTFSTAC